MNRAVSKLSDFLVAYRYQIVSFSIEDNFGHPLIRIDLRKFYGSIGKDLGSEEALLAIERTLKKTDSRIYHVDVLPDYSDRDELYLLMWLVRNLYDPIEIDDRLEEGRNGV